MSTTPGLNVAELHKAYPTPAEPLVVLRGVGLEMRAGQSLAIVGPSGSGKSTLLNIIGTLDRPTSGQVCLDGVDPFTLGAKDLSIFRGRHIGFVFQEHHLLPQCTAIENVLVPRLAVGKVRREERDRAGELLSRVGLADRQAHVPAELSGGERQRVAIARAMMNRPTLLLCDEPTGNLDAKSAHLIGELLRDAAQEAQAMLIVVTHSAMLAEMFPRRLEMTEGKLVER